MDLIKQLGPMALGSRLKRLTVRMNKDVSRIYNELGIEFKARWFPVAYLLSKHSPLAITDVAQRLNYTHTAIKNFANEMARKGLIESVADKADRRRRMLRLSKKGREVVNCLIPVWQEVGIVARNLVKSSDPNLISSIESIERQLDKQEVYPRIRERLRPQLLGSIDIVEYKPAYKRYFKSLNTEWLNKYFRTEPDDKIILDDPKGQIIDRGGAVLFARLDGRIVGTAALIRHEGDLYELAKMAVTESFRRRLVGTKLTTAIIERAKVTRAHHLYLETHPRLKAAQGLYEKVGFVKIKKSPIAPKFNRRRIVMRFNLESSANDSAGQKY